MGLIPALFVWVTPQGIEWLYFVIIGLMGLIGALLRGPCFSPCRRNGRYSVAIPALAPHLDRRILLYDESFELAVFLGAILIFSGNYYNIRLEARQQKAD